MVKKARNSIRSLFKTVDLRLSQSIFKLAEYVRIPSISSDPEYVGKMAELLSTHLMQYGFDVKFLGESAYPLIYAYLDVGSDKTVIFSNHYDIPDVGNLEAWASHPFDPIIRKGRMYGRGTTETKGPIVSRLFAIDVYSQLKLDPPVNIKFILEGDGELGNKTLRNVLKKKPEILDGDVCIYNTGYQNIYGVQEIIAGYRGLFAFSLELKRLKTTMPSSMLPIVGNPIHEIASLFCILMDKSGNIIASDFPKPKIPEFSNDVFDKIAKACKARLDSSKSVIENPTEINVENLVHEMIFKPKINISNISLGLYDTPQIATINPYIKVNMDIRLPIGLDIKKVKEYMSKFISENIRKPYVYEIIEAYPAGYTDINNPIIKIAMQATHKVFNRKPYIIPIHEMSNPIHLFSEHIPTICMGPDDYMANTRLPNESINIDLLHMDIKRNIYLMELLARADNN